MFVEKIYKNCHPLEILMNQLLKDSSKAFRNDNYPKYRNKCMIITREMIVPGMRRMKLQVTDVELLKLFISYQDAVMSDAK